MAVESGAPPFAVRVSPHHSGMLQPRTTGQTRLMNGVQVHGAGIGHAVLVDGTPVLYDREKRIHTVEFEGKLVVLDDASSVTDNGRPTDEILRVYAAISPFDTHQRYANWHQATQEQGRANPLLGTGLDVGPGLAYPIFIVPGAGRNGGIDVYVMEGRKMQRYRDDLRPGDVFSLRAADATDPNHMMKGSVSRAFNDNTVHIGVVGTFGTHDLFAAIPNFRIKVVQMSSAIAGQLNQDPEQIRERLDVDHGHGAGIGSECKAPFLERGLSADIVGTLEKWPGADWADAIVVGEPITRDLIAGLGVQGRDTQVKGGWEQ